MAMVMRSSATLPPESPEERAIAAASLEEVVAAATAEVEDGGRRSRRGAAKRVKVDRESRPNAYTDAPAFATSPRGNLTLHELAALCRNLETKLGPGYKIAPTETVRDPNAAHGCFGLLFTAWPGGPLEAHQFKRFAINLREHAVGSVPPIPFPTTYESVDAALDEWLATPKDASPVVFRCRDIRSFQRKWGGSTHMLATHGAPPFTRAQLAAIVAALEDAGITCRASPPIAQTALVSHGEMGRPFDPDEDPQ